MSNETATKAENVILEEKDEIDLEKKTGDEPDETDEEKEDNKVPVSKNTKSESEKEEEEEELDERFQIEILEDNVIKFENGKIKRIYELLSGKYSGMDYFIREKNGNLHIVKYNEKLNLNINGFVDSLFKYYSANETLKQLSNNVIIKGNDKFSVVENLDTNLIGKVVDDLSKLLSKKK
jgi:hypothetical protein